MTKRKPKELHKPHGRPCSVTPEAVAKLEYAFALDCTDAEACLYADLTPSAFYEWQKRNPYFLERKQQLKNRPFLLARTTIVNALESDADMALKYMERKKKDEFSLRTEMTGAEGEKLGMVIYCPEEKKDDKK